MVFRGLAAPGVPGLTASEDLVAIWRSREGQRFQNYRAFFTILDVGVIPRQWLWDLMEENPLSAVCPPAWRKWVETGRYEALQAIPQKRIRSKEEQLPYSEVDWSMLQSIYDYFAADSRWHLFEHFAARIVELMDRNISVIDVTRPTVDGGRDGVGTYQIGLKDNAIQVTFALEAKCYEPGHNSVGVKETARLISRLRHRQFGVLVTTSFVAQQAYTEIVDDAHPVIIISGADMVDILKSAGIADFQSLL